jgi:hypothetical protein
MKNLHHGGANLAKTVFPWFGKGEVERGEGEFL